MILDQVPVGLAQAGAQRSETDVVQSTVRGNHKIAPPVKIGSERSQDLFIERGTELQTIGHGTGSDIAQARM